MSNLNKRLDEVQISRGIAIFGVLTVHGTSTAVLNVPHESSFFPLYNLFHTLGTLGTPTFIMLSSFILFYSYYKRAFTLRLVLNFFNKRLKFILIPYIVISLFYFFIKWRVMGLNTFETYDLALERLQYYLVYGKAHPHLYFVFLSVQFYLVFPLLLWALKKSILLRRYAILIGLVIQLFWLYGNLTYKWIPSQFSIIFAYAAFYLLGAYLGIHYEQLKESMVKAPAKGAKIIGVICFFCGFFGFAFVIFRYLVHIGLWDKVTNYFPEVLNPFYYRLFWLSYNFFVTVVILFIANYIDKFTKRSKQFFMYIGSLSFGIYLIHPFFLLLLRPLFETSQPIGIFHVYQSLIYFLTLLFSILTVYGAYRFIPFSWVIFGKSTIPYAFRKG